MPSFSEWLDWLRNRRRPCVRQSAGYECGAAAMATVACAYGYHLSLDAAREIVNTDRNGTTIWYIKDGAESLGFVARPARATYAALQQLPMPTICHYGDGIGHWVVVYAPGEHYVVLADPAVGMRRLPRAEFERRWSGYAIDIRPGPDFQRKKEAAPPWRVFARMVLAERRMLSATVAATLLVGVLGWSTAAFLQVLLDRVLPAGQLGLLLPLALGLALLSGVQAFLQIARSTWEATVGRRLQVSYISRYLDHLVSLPAQVIEIRCKGVLFQRIVESGTLRRAVGQGVVTLAGDLVTLLLALAVLTVYAPAIALLALLAIPLMLMAVVAYNRPIRVRRDRQMFDFGDLNSHFTDNLDLIRPMKVFHAEERMAGAMKSQFDNVTVLGQELQVLTAIPAALATLVNGLTTVAVLWYGATRVAGGALTPGQLVFLFGVLAFILVPVQRIPAMAVDLQDALILIEKVEGTLSLKPERAVSGAQRLPELKGEIHLENVSFGYGPRHPVLRNLTTTIAAGQRVAIVGETGSGKTTLAAILAGLFVPDQGTVTFDGHSLNDLDRSDLRRHISAVFQKPCLLEGTIRENITLGAPAEQERVEEAARLAQADAFILGLPLGYGSVVVSGGGNLSGGQAQRISIARAMLKNAPVMIVDEATSNLDSQTEHEVWANLNRLRAGKTTIVIAHRLSTVMEADKVIVLEGGRIVEEGTHAELLQRGGAYHRMFRWQAQAAAGPSAH